MKVLFLDIDGVINTMAEVGYTTCFGEKIKSIVETSMMRRREGSPYPFCPNSLYNLHRIVRETQCKIVISSTWRHGKDVDTMKGWFLDSTIKDAIIDKTPSFSVTSRPDLVDKRGYVQRGEEIFHWLSEHPEVTSFAVLDDDNDMDAVRRDFFQTNCYDGLNFETANKVIHHLNKQEYIKNQYRLNIALQKFKSELTSCLDFPSEEEKMKLIQGIGEEVTKWVEQEDKIRENMRTSNDKN